MTEITGKSVYISLSIDMYETILKDIRVFRCGSKAGNDSYKLSYSQFLKRIFLNLYNKKEVMEYVKECVKRYEKKIEQHKKKSGKNKNHGEVIKLGNNIICKLIEQISGFDDNLLEILFFTAENSNIKKVIEKVKENSSLDGFQEYELPNGAALALIFVSNIEYYCNLRMIEREKIIYRREIEDIETYIKNKNIITIRKNNGQIVTVLPYRIGIVDESNRHCLACFRIKKESEGWYFEKTEKGLSDIEKQKMYNRYAAQYSVFRIWMLIIVSIFIFVFFYQSGNVYSGAAVALSLLALKETLVDRNKEEERTESECSPGR